MTSDADVPSAACDNCKIREFSLCDGVLTNTRAHKTVKPTQTNISVRSRHNIYDRGQTLDMIPVISEGWAFSFVLLPDGRRQILSILLPGDMISTHAVFRNSLDFSLQALTDVKYCTFSRAELPKFGEYSADTIAAWRTANRAEFDEYTSRIVDLGRRAADERIARFMLRLWGRKQRIGRAHNGRFFFPLRQQHIADALGLTSVHVSRVLNGFRREGLIELTRSELHLVDIPGVQRIAEME